MFQFHLIKNSFLDNKKVHKKIMSKNQLKKINILDNKRVNKKTMNKNQLKKNKIYKKPLKKMYLNSIRTLLLKNKRKLIIK